MRLFHYTDAAGLDGIHREGLIRPFPQPLLGGRAAVWLTDTPHHVRMTQKVRRALGVDNEQRFPADRSEHEVFVLLHPEREPVFLWSNVAFEYPGAWAATDGPLGARPDTWWVSFEPIKIPTEKGTL